MTDQFFPTPSDGRPVFQRQVYERWLELEWGTEDQQRRYREALDWFKQHLEEDELFKRLEALL